MNSSNPSTPSRPWFAIIVSFLPALAVISGVSGVAGGVSLRASRVGDGQAAATPTTQGTGGGRATQRTASQAPPPDVAAQTYPPEQIQAGAPLFAARCGFCHGRDAAGGETGPDLTRSLVTAQDLRGDKLIPVIREGRVDKGMPGFNLAAGDLSALVAFIHDQKRRAESQEGNRRTVDDADLQSGNAEAGRQYFNGAGGCSRCHSPTGDLAGIANRIKGLTLLQRMLYPTGGRGGPAPKAATATVTTRAGETITGKLVYRDEFVIALMDGSGWHRSFPLAQVKATVDNPLDAHSDQLAKYTDDDMHNVLAYLQTLR